MNKNNVYKKLAISIKPYLWWLILAIFALIVAKLIEAGLYKFLVPKLLDEALIAKNLESSRFIPAAILLALCLRAMFGFLYKFFIGFISKGFARDLRIKVLTHMLNLPISFFNRNSIGNLISKVNYDVEQVSRALADSVLELLNSIIAIIFFVGVMLSFSWRISIFLISTPLIAWFLLIVNKKIRKYSTQLQQSIGDVSQIAHQIVEACQVIRIFEAISQETEKIKQSIVYNFKKELKIILASVISESIMLVIPGLLMVLLIYAVTSNFLKISPGALIGLLTTMLALMRPCKQLAEVNYVIAKGLAAASSIFELLDEPIEQRYISKGNFSELILKNKLLEQCSIKLDNVSFSYNNKSEQDPSNSLVLEGINLTFKPGQVTALVGRSGAGKSTLISLLPRFYLTTSGSISINTLNINEIDLHELRKQFAVVTQRIILLNDTIANNIAYGGMNNASRKQIIAAAHAANAMEFIEQLPEGLDTHIGNNGNLLSGGQRQRIAIARAILKDAPILILDEATSALDTLSEQYIQTALNNLMQNKTTILIAHRMSTIEKADQIAVLDYGKLVAVGTHQELINNSYYSSLHNALVNEAI